MQGCILICTSGGFLRYEFRLCLEPVVKVASVLTAALYKQLICTRLHAKRSWTFITTLIQPHLPCGDENHATMFTVAAIGTNFTSFCLLTKTVLVFMKETRRFRWKLYGMLLPSRRTGATV